MRFVPVFALATLVQIVVAANSAQCGPKHGRCADKYCCSARGFCGRSLRHCQVGCQINFGHCIDHPNAKFRIVLKASSKVAPPKVDSPSSSKVDPSSSSKAASPSPPKAASSKAASSKVVPPKVVPPKAASSKVVPPKVVPPKAASSKAASQKAAPAKAASSKVVSPKVVPPKAASSKAAPPKEASSKAAPPKEASSKVVPPKEASSKAAPPKEASSKVVPPKEASSKVAPPKEASSKVAPPKEASSKVASPKAVPPKAVPPKAVPPKVVPPKVVPPKVVPPKVVPSKAASPPPPKAAPLKRKRVQNGPYRNQPPTVHSGTACGPGRPKCQNSCCSSQNFCGTTQEYCGLACQEKYGYCIPKPALTPPNHIAYNSVRLSGHKTPCKKPRIRKEFRELTPAQRASYIAAIKCLMSSPSTLPASFKSGSIYHDLLVIHYMSNDLIHGTVLFLPWHRVFMLTFEDLLRDVCKYKAPLPYWDWTIDSQAPERSPIFAPSFMGGNGAPGTECLQNGPFVGLSGHFKKTCIKRKFNLRDKIFPFPTKAIVQTILRKKDFPTFQRNLQNTPHAIVHISIGGDMGKLAYSTGDPVFFLHHAFVDAVYWRWQQQNPTVAYSYSGNRVKDGPTNVATLDDHVSMWGMGQTYTVRETLNTQGGGRFCYRYSNSIIPKSHTLEKRGDTVPETTAAGSSNLSPSVVPVVGGLQVKVTPLKNGTPPSPSDRKDEAHLRHIDQMAEKDHKAMGHSQKTVHEIHQVRDRLNSMCDTLNQLTDEGKFLSISSLAVTMSPKVEFVSATDEQLAKVDSYIDSAIKEVENRIGPVL
ncbi:hypothetical protein BASA50_001587 [Batrachochytrium salamandrivorans]|uniref:Chitin-binding type-1 domain-containing protein n=1 Tax=Batrachochytrium salamandrivorans TaxID=1357716 RepID=A0ABQ8FNS3_9FUNG|nr:hypothetical protein BASA61_009209 [Batrachochytrium salamandrivorans]KAH6601444.1 hypothetical protein BASA50_001587 [Batrachochytrium salamandrivorans]